ncbi:MAG: hypothetical protein MR794_01565 [Bacteroidales bacterium]|nr:hypothetical protein [Bacteroidales bacterium]
MLLLMEGRIADSIYRFPPWPVMTAWLVVLVIMSAQGKKQYFLSLKWPWILLLVSLVGNAIWQNMH